MFVCVSFVCVSVFPVLAEERFDIVECDDAGGRLYGGEDQRKNDRWDSPIILLPLFHIILHSTLI